MLGRDPTTERDELMREVSLHRRRGGAAQVAEGVSNALDYVQGVHPDFNRERAEQFLATTDVKLSAPACAQLSKGMVTQLHLALVLAIKARLLVLDEPTLGLDLLVRRRFYDTLLNDYMDEERTILVTTHQVEEIEHLLTDVLFIEQGSIVLDYPGGTDRRALRAADREAASSSMRRGRCSPFNERSLLGRTVLFYDDVPREQLARWVKWARPPSPTCSWPGMQKEAA